MTGGQGYSIAGAVAASIGTAILILTGLYSWRKSHQRNKALDDPCDIYYENERNDIKYTHTVNTSLEPQYIRFTLKFKTEVNIKCLWITFEGEGELAPDIEEVYEWDMGIKHKPHDHNIWKVEDGGWNWTYNTPLHKHQGDSLNIGVQCIAKESGSSFLLVYLGCTEERAKKHRWLPLEARIGV